MPGGPAVICLQLRNRRGLPRAVPTEFARDGKSLRRGLTIGVEYLPKDSFSSPYTAGAKWQALTPRASEEFEPGDGARTLEPAEEFEAFRLDLAGRFDFSKPGFYRITATFDEMSGIVPAKVVTILPSGGDD